MGQREYIYIAQHDQTGEPMGFLFFYYHWLAPWGEHAIRTAFQWLEYDWTKENDAQKVQALEGQFACFLARQCLPDSIRLGFPWERGSYVVDFKLRTITTYGPDGDRWTFADFSAGAGNHPEQFDLMY